MAHQTIQRSATIGIFNAIASHTIPQALPLMPRIVPGIGMSQQSPEAGAFLDRPCEDWVIPPRYQRSQQ